MEPGVPDRLGRNFCAASGADEKAVSKQMHDTLDPSVIDRANKRTGKWAEAEDIQLKDAVQRHGANNWFAIAVLVL
jgi:hypothetical protein